MLNIFCLAEFNLQILQGISKVCLYLCEQCGVSWHPRLEVTLSIYHFCLIIRMCTKDMCLMCSSTRPLEEGDIVNIDVTVFIGGHHGDCSETFLVGIHIDVIIVISELHREQRLIMMQIHLINIQIYHLLIPGGQCGR